jgi:hypothetical protein
MRSGQDVFVKLAQAGLPLVTVTDGAGAQGS